MKRILAALALALASAVSFGATLNPVQLLNPAGSTSGQTILSTGPTTAPAWGSIALSNLPQAAANTVLGNGTASTAAVTALAVPSCSASGNALKWTSASGFGCVTGLALTANPLSQFAATTSAQLLGVISDETGSGSLVFGTSPTITTPTINGITSGANAGAGIIGQCIPSTSGTVTMATGTTINVTSISLTAGDWLVNGSIIFQTTGTISNTGAGFSTTTLTLPSAPLYAGSSATLNAGANSAVAIPMQRFNVTTTTTVFLVAVEAFTTGGSTVGQMIACRWH